jgi:deazaflavin-dependent oxidoreductase (nitroreductase family)
VIKRRLLQLQNRALNRLAVASLRLGLSPPTYALLETTGRRTGWPRQVPVANGLQGDTFWLIVGLGRQAQYLRNIEANPHVRVKVRPARLRDGIRMRWREGTAHPMPEDDASARHRRLGEGRPGYRLDGILLRGLSRLGPGMSTVRIELDR